MTVAVRRDGDVVTVSLERPRALNALNTDLRAQLHTAVRDLADQPEVRVVVLRGSGRAFSAGADLRESRQPEGSWVARRHEAGAWQRLLDDLERLPQPTVAVLHGWAIGGAVLLAACCDLRLASTNLRLSIPEVPLGIPLTWAGLPRLVREIGLPRTRDLVMTGRTVDAATAQDWGLVQRLAPPERLEDALTGLVAEIVDNPAGPVALTKAALAALGRDGLAPGWADADLLAWSVTEEESKAARDAYVRRLQRLRRPS